MMHHDGEKHGTQSLTDGYESTWITTAVLIVAVTLLAVVPVEAEQKSPQDLYGGRPNNLDQLPEAWVTDNPIELVVSFNLESAPNSVEANAFLRNWYQSISALPYDVDLQVKRIVSPGRYSYAVSLTFNNWAEYREYESSDDFLSYYYESWKPRVKDAEERVFILDYAVTQE